jgi:two-component system cell cycle response regulator
MVGPDRIHVLLVEDNPGDARLVQEMLSEDKGTEFTFTLAPTVKDALHQLASDQAAIDAVLLDLSLPDESGLATVQRVVDGAGTRVVVVMTGAGDEELGVAAMEAGAQDYLVKGQVDGRLLRRALRFALERQAVRQQLQDLSLKDDLTGLNNRRGFLVLAEQQLRQARRQRLGCLLLFLDLDGLKVVNDTFGHAEGNRALVEAADVLRGSLRQSDILARFGGDEFGALCMAANTAEEGVVRDRLATALAAVNAKPDRAYPLSFSMGMLSCRPSEDDAPIESLLERADQLMYREKKNKKRAS